MPTDFGRRVKAARKHAQLTQKQLAPLAGMSQSNLSELETVAHESGKTLQLAEACGVNARWLATGEGEMLPPHHLAREPAARWGFSQHSKEGATATPSGGSLAHQLSHAKLTITPILSSWDDIVSKRIPARFNLTVRDNSMELSDPPSMREGDIATFVAANSAMPGQVVLVLDAHGNAYIRRYVEKTSNHWQAVARHAAYQPLDSHLDGLQVVAVQVGGFWG